MKRLKRFTDLLSETLTSVSRGGEWGDDEIIFTLKNGNTYKLYHDQYCCEDVYIADINGDLSDLENSPITLADESFSSENPPIEMWLDEVFQWTFYRLATIKGYVDIRWCGTSNGYYSVSVDWKKI